MNCKKTSKNIDEYIVECKYDLILYIILLCIFTSLLLYFSYKTNSIFFLFLILFFLLDTIGRLQAFINIKQIKKHLEGNNLISKIGKIEFWNEKDYILTEKYFIISQRGKVTSFKYNEIKEMCKKTIVKLSSPSLVDEYLVIKLMNGEEFRVLTFSLSLQSENYKDISKFLLDKNNNINYY